MPKVKKIPQRMCVGCQEMRPKRELIRVVRTPEETIVIDPTGKRSGRGAYVCPDEACFLKALKAKRFEKALKCPISSEIIDELGKKLVK